MNTLLKDYKKHKKKVGEMNLGQHVNDKICSENKCSRAYLKQCRFNYLDISSRYLESAMFLPSRHQRCLSDILSELEMLRPT